MAAVHRCVVIFHAPKTGIDAVREKMVELARRDKVEEYEIILISEEGEATIHRIIEKKGGLHL